MGVLTILFSIFLLSLTTGQVIRIPLAQDITVTLSDLFLVILLVGWGIEKVTTKKKTTYPYKNRIFLFAGLAFLSLLITPIHLTTIRFIASFLYLVRWICYAGIYFVVLDLPDMYRKRLSYVLYAVGSLFLLFGIIQYIFYQDLGNLAYLGWDKHVFRLFSTLLDPNFAGVFLVLLFFFFSREFFEAQQQKNRIYPGILALVTIAEIILTYSRTAYIALIIPTAVFFLVRKNYRAVLGIIISVFLLYGGIYLFSHGYVAENKNLLRTASINARIAASRTAVTLVGKNPFFGVGFNAYRYALYQYKMMQDVGDFSSHADAGTDNSYLFVLATTGAIGFIAYILLLWQIFKDAFLIRNRYVLLSLGAICIGSIFINALFYPIIMAWMWLVVGTMERR